MDIHSINLFDPDLKADEQVNLKIREIASLSPAFPLRHDNSVAFTLIDGLSRGESFTL